MHPATRRALRSSSNPLPTCKRSVCQTAVYVSHTEDACRQGRILEFPCETKTKKAVETGNKRSNLTRSSVHSRIHSTVLHFCVPLAQSPVGYSTSFLFVFFLHVAVGYSTVLHFFYLFFILFLHRINTGHYSRQQTHRNQLSERPEM